MKDKTNAKFSTRYGNTPTYVCDCCGKRTRETGLGESGCGLCAYCYEEGGWENTLSDGGCTQAEYDIAIAALQLQYGRKAA